MYIRCPNCGRRGYLPDRLAPEANSLRCRKCKAHFTTSELARKTAERRGVPVFDSPASVGVTEKPASFLAEGFFSGFDERPPSGRERGPGDSNYELTFTLQDVGGDSGSDWDAPTEDIEPEAPSSDEIEALRPAAAALRESDSWHLHFIKSWGMTFIGTALGLIAVSVPLIAYLVWRTIGGGGPSPTLIAGLACAVGLLMISVPTMLLATCLTDLVRDVRRVREHLERTAGRGE